MEIKISPGQSINQAIAQLNRFPNARLILNQGIYEEKVLVDIDRMEIIGQGEVKIINHDYALMRDQAGNEYTTFKTATMTITGNNVKLINLTIINDAGRGEDVGQAVALAVYGDQFSATRCRLLAHQDTLFVGPLPDDLRQRYQGFLPDSLLNFTKSRQYYHDCHIAGTVDFIFGAGEAVFDHCFIECLATPVTYIAAPATAADQAGFHFLNCTISGSAQNVFLARPWRPNGQVTFEDCCYEVRLHPDVMSIWAGTDRHLTARFKVIDKGKVTRYFH